MRKWWGGRTLLLTGAFAALLAGGGVSAATSAASGTAGAAVRGTAPPPRPGHRAPGPGRRKGPPGWTGEVDRVGSGYFLLRSGPPGGAGAPLTVELGSATGFAFAPGVAAAESELRSGETVTVQGSVYGSRVEAREVTIHLHRVAGRVTGVDGEDIGVIEPDDRTAVIRTDSVPTVAVGQTVEGFGFWHGDTLYARAWRVVPVGLGGTVETVSGDGAVLLTPAGEKVRLTWNGETVFAAGPHRSGSAALLTAGRRIRATGEWVDGSFAADRIDVGP